MNNNSPLITNGRILFLKKFIESPTQIGSLTPSSIFLAEKMLACIDWGSVRALAELGAGTGVFTEYINDRKHPDCVVAVFEQDKTMRSAVAARFARLNYFEDARFLSSKINSLGVDSLDAVVSGLPFALLEDSVRKTIIDEVVNLLKANGTFVAFQYSLQMRSLLVKKFSQVEISFVPFNLPPAFVYVCHK